MTLYVLSRPDVNNGPQVLSGISLAHTKLSARQLAAIIAQVALGETGIKLSVSQLIKSLGCNQSYVWLAMQLSPGKRAAIASGTDETSFIVLANHLKQSRQPTAMSVSA
jgi:hypothetical protein